MVADEKISNTAPNFVNNESGRVGEEYLYRVKDCAVQFGPDAMREAAVQTEGVVQWDEDEVRLLQARIKQEQEEQEMAWKTRLLEVRV